MRIQLLDERHQVSNSCVEIQACIVGFSRFQLVAKHIHCLSLYLYLLLMFQKSAYECKYGDGNDYCVGLSL